MILTVMLLTSKDSKTEVVELPKEEEKAIRVPSQTGMQTRKIGKRRINQRYKMAKKKMNQILTGSSLILKPTKRSSLGMSCMMSKS